MIDQPIHRQIVLGVPAPQQIVFVCRLSCFVFVLPPSPNGSADFEVHEGVWVASGADRPSGNGPQRGLPPGRAARLAPQS